MKRSLLLLLSLGIPVACDQAPPAGPRAEGQRVSPKTTRDGLAYVVVQSGWVSVLETATERVVATIPVPDLPQGIATTPAGDRAYVARINADAVSVIETATNQVVAEVKVGVAPIGVA